MQDVVVIDIETRSACDLKAAGSYQYAKHETTRLLTVAWRFRGEDSVWLPGLTAVPPQAYVDLHLPGVAVHVGDGVPAALCRLACYPFAGHNVWTFDRLVWAECTEGFDHVKWLDTYPLALSCGMPGGLDAIGKLLWGEGKYDAGKESLKKASRCTPGDCEPENVPLGQLLLVAKYNVQDVRLTDALYTHLLRGARIPPFEDRVKRAHDAINSRGIRIDLPLIRKLVTLADESKAKAIDSIRELTDGALPDQAAVQSGARVKAWLDAQGLKFKSLKKNLVARFIDTHREDTQKDEEQAEEETHEDTVGIDLPRIVKVLQLRMSALRITGGKLEAALSSMDPDHRIRYWAAYHAAHTGRWAGRRIQPHNLPRPKDGIDTWALLDTDLSYDAVRRLLPTDARGVDGRLLYPYLSVDDAASALLRGIFLPDEGETLAAADLANIEARVLPWCAGEKWLMQAFWDGADPYLSMAENIMGPRADWPVYPDPVTGKPLPPKKHPYRQILGKVPYLACIAEGTPILTESGWVSIESVRLTDKVWDGEEWVQHGGVVCNGIRDCVRVSGVVMTDDHLVLTDDGWVEAGGFHASEPSLSGTRLTSGRFVMSKSGRKALSLASSRSARAAEREPRRHPTLSRSGLLGATRAPRSGQLSQALRTTTCATTQSTGSASRRESRPLCRGARTGPISRGTATGVGESRCTRHGLRTGLRSSRTFSLSTGGTGRNLHSTGGTTTGTTNRGTCVSSPDRSSKVTGVRVYDIRNCGPRNRYQAGRLIVHNCGYQGGPEAVENYAAGMGYKLSDYGTSGMTMMKAYRSLHTAIAGEYKGDSEDGYPIFSGGVWTQTQNAAIECATNFTRTYACRCVFHMEHGHLICTLPSGRRLVYRNARVEIQQTKFGPKPALSYIHPRYGLKFTYGGSLVENIVQAISRDVLAHGMVLLEDEGMPVVLHCHDEACCSTRDDRFHDFMKCMTTCPPWLVDFPLAAEGCTMPRYSKAPPPGKKDELWRNGSKQ